jgi:outer membrane protein
VQTKHILAARLVLATVGLSFLAGPSLAGDSNGNFQIRAGGTGIFFDDDVTSVRTNTGVDLKSVIGADAKIDDIAVPTLTLTYFFTNNFAIEAVCCTDHVTVEGTGGLAPLGDIAEAWTLPPIVTAQYRLNRIGGFQPYVGAGIQWIHYWGDTSDNALGATKVKFDDSFGFALQAGIDYDLGAGWSLNLDVKKSWIDTKVTWVNNAALGGADVIAKADVDPLWVTVSVGYRFNLFGPGPAPEPAIYHTPLK